jgi:hypothetical protein
MSLSGIFIDLWRTAQETGQDAARELNGGARLAVRVLGDVTTLTISRKQKPVGAVELRTFLHDCGVPESAVRFPQEGQNVREREGSQWHSISYRWRNESETSQ